MIDLNEKAIKTAEKHIHDILSLAFNHTAHDTTLVIFDRQSPLSVALTTAYQHVLPSAKFIDFDQISIDAIFAEFKQLAPHALVVMIQSTRFRMKDFRIRVELFEQGLKVIEYPQLARMLDSQQIYYIDSLAYDPDYFRTVGYALKNKIDQASSAIVEGGGERLIFSTPLELAKLNIGDYSQMTNIGGQFPIGEVFTEAQTLEAVNGRVQIFAFADMEFAVKCVSTPITLVVEQGRVTEVLNSTDDFDQVLAKIRGDEAEVWLRELGFGMNRAFTRERVVSDVGTYERMCGVHLSLGAKHSVYKKPQFKRGTTWHHVDVFAVTERVYLDDVVVYQEGKWMALDANVADRQQRQV